MNLYTYIFEFREGTYITQVKAINAENSVPKWLENIKNEKEEIYQLNTKSILEIEQKLLDEKPILLRGIHNVWSFSFTIKQGYGLVNVIQTEQGFIEKNTIIELIKEQVPNSKNLIHQLKNIPAIKWQKKPYIRIINSKNANQKGSEWQFKENIILEHKTEGTIILDLLKNGQIGGFELINELD